MVEKPSTIKFHPHSSSYSSNVIYGPTYGVFLSQGLTIPISLTSLSRAEIKGLTSSCEILVIGEDEKVSFIGMSY